MNSVALPGNFAGMLAESSPDDPFRDRALAFRLGDRSAAKSLFVDLAPGMLVFLRCRVPRGIDADDLLQDVWIRAWKSREQYVDGNFRAWIYQIARNLIIDESRRRRPDSLPAQFDPVDHVEHSKPETLDHLQSCFGVG